MFSKWRDRIRRTLGLRLAVWYAGLFLVSSTVVIGVTYLLLSGSLQQRDRDIISTRLGEYAATYRTNGLSGLERLLRAEQTTAGQESLFVRILGPFEQAVFVRMPTDWGSFDLQQLRLAQAGGNTAWAYAVGTGHAARLEVAQVRLRDGTLVQVGKSTQSRDQLLQRFRTILSLVLLGCAGIGAVGGALLTRSALRPVHDLTSVVTQIIQTGQVDARVPTTVRGDALDDLSRLFNTMLDRIDTLVTGMQGALDNVAHDLRTPLTRLRSSAERVLAKDPSPEDLREALADCMEESEHVSTMLRSLMDISEAETGTMRLDMAEVDLEAVLIAMADMYAGLAEEKKVALHVQPIAALRVHADEQRMRQVVANLLDNSIKYCPAGGKITLGSRRGSDSVEITVADTGIGISLADQSRIWDRLYRADSSRSQRGLGLGLSLVKAVVEAHGGTVAVESEPGHGSTFTAV